MIFPEQCIVVSPDEGGAKRSEIINSIINTTLIINITITSSSLISPSPPSPSSTYSTSSSMCSSSSSGLWWLPIHLGSSLQWSTTGEPTTLKKTIILRPGTKSPSWETQQTTLQPWQGEDFHGTSSSLDYVSLVQFREGSVAPEFVGPSDDLVHLVRFWISPSSPDVTLRWRSLPRSSESPTGCSTSSSRSKFSTLWWIYIHFDENNLDLIFFRFLGTSLGLTALLLMTW